MLAMPEEESNCAKLRSAPAAPSGTPSSKICMPDAPSNNPDSPLSSSAERNSFQVVSNCAAVRTWPNSYSRANLSRMFKLRTNCRADARGSALIEFRVGFVLTNLAETSLYLQTLIKTDRCEIGRYFSITTVGWAKAPDKPRAAFCSHFTNREHTVRRHTYHLNMEQIVAGCSTCRASIQLRLNGRS